MPTKVVVENTCACMRTSMESKKVAIDMCVPCHEFRAFFYSAVRSLQIQIEFQHNFFSLALVETQKLCKRIGLRWNVWECVCLFVLASVTNANGTTKSMDFSLPNWKHCRHCFPAEQTALNCVVRCIGQCDIQSNQMNISGCDPIRNVLVYIFKWSRNVRFTMRIA